MKNIFNKEEIKKFPLRLPSDLKNDIEVFSMMNMISQNEFIVRVLKDWINENMVKVNEKEN